MRRIERYELKTASVADANSVTPALSCVVSESPTEQAEWLGVQVTLQDAASDANLAVVIEQSLSGIDWTTLYTTSSFASAGTVVSAKQDVAAVGFIRARVSTAGATATRATVTLLLTRIS
jgi:hypothetical protein